MFSSYSLALLGILIILLTLVIQGFVAARSKASQAGAVPGKIDLSLSHSSFVFRANRTFSNSLENMPQMLGAAFLAVFVGANAMWTAVFIWFFTMVFPLKKILVLEVIFI
jgi:uncharacterized MAPEG superfamily protein